MRQGRLTRQARDYLDNRVRALTAQGWSARQIAHALDVCERTVQRRRMALGIGRPNPWQTKETQP